jgi:molybdenum cofactor cytidylyltransferase
MKHVIFFMAGGNSRRFHSNKLLSKINDKHLFEYGLKALLELKKSNPQTFEIYVITQYEKLADICTSSYGQDVHVVLDQSCTQGISYTVKAGLLAAKFADFYTFLAADQPFVRADTLMDYFVQGQKSGKSIFGYSYEEVLYNPMSFSSIYKEELLSLSEDQGGKKVAKKHPEQIYAYPLKNAQEIADIDFQSDLSLYESELSENHICHIF